MGPFVKKVAEKKAEGHKHDDISGDFDSEARVACEEFSKGPEKFELRDFIVFCTIQNGVPEDSEDVEDKYRRAVGQCK